MGSEPETERRCRRKRRRRRIELEEHVLRVSGEQKKQQGDHCGGWSGGDANVEFRSETLRCTWGANFDRDKRESVIVIIVSYRNDGVDV
jgi:hypothetical protein